MTVVPLTRDDFWRRIPAAPSAGPYKEWHHFIVVTEDLCLLVNFSIDDRVARVVTMGTTPAWAGAVESWPMDAARFGKASTRLDIAEHRLVVREDGYHVVVRREDLAVDLTFRPRTEPMIARDHPVGGGRRLSWLICPIMSVAGTVRIAGRQTVVEDAIGYHDHNWGHFAWGDDFCWEWGIVLPRDSTATWAVVVSSLQNRARTVSTLEQLLVWHHGRNVLALSNQDVRITAVGRRSSGDAYTLPAVMRLLAGGDHGDVPERLRVVGERGDRRVSVDFAVRDHARLAVPSERDPRGVVSIHECIGEATVSFCAGDGEVTGGGTGVFELVRGR